MATRKQTPAVPSGTLTLNVPEEQGEVVKKVLRVKPKKSVKWDESAVDNEGMGKKKSKSKFLLM